MTALMVLVVIAFGAWRTVLCRDPWDQYYLANERMLASIQAKSHTNLKIILSKEPLFHCEKSRMSPITYEIQPDL